jgi:plasmid stabilization system protein ParE
VRPAPKWRVWPSSGPLDARSACGRGEHSRLHRTARPLHQASTVVRAITARANLLDQFKGLGKAGSLPHTREYKVARLPYIIVYTVRDEDVVILRVWHERQDRP